MCAKLMALSKVGFVPSLGKEAQTPLGEPWRRFLRDTRPFSPQAPHRHLCVFTLLKGVALTWLSGSDLSGGVGCLPQPRGNSELGT